MKCSYHDCQNRSQSESHISGLTKSSLNLLLVADSAASVIFTPTNGEICITISG